MSRVGLKKIQIPSGVKVVFDGQVLHVTGPKGTCERSVRSEIAVSVEGAELAFSRTSEDRTARALHGLTRNEAQNMIVGVTEGYIKVLEINGVGYRAAVQGREVVLNIGYSHPVNFPLPAGIDASVEKQTILTIKGTDKYRVGQVAANIRALRAPEPYKGKGIKYREERILRKEGKSGKAGGK